MTELRYDRASGDWRLYAPERGRRPHVAHDLSRLPRMSTLATECPFCPGNEDQLAPVLLQTPALPIDGPAIKGTSAATWQTRVVENKYPALTPGPRTVLSTDPARYDTPTLASGHHEVIVETPRHDRRLATMTEGEITAVIHTWQRRCRELEADEAHESVVVFRNHGGYAGSSIPHPHSQIMATGFTPPALAWHQAAVRDHYADGHGSLVRDLMAAARAAKTRLVTETGDFIAFVPYAAEVAFEIWIVPMRARARFADISDGERPALAALLRDCLGRLAVTLGDAPYNLVIVTPSRGFATHPAAQWYLRILPRTTHPGGFEVAAGINIVPSLPEDDAARLREARPE